MAIDTRPYFITRACAPDEHEFVEETDGGMRCSICKFGYDSLVEIVGQDL